MLEQICDSIIMQDLNNWERKSINNERLWKLQHVASKLNKRIKIVKNDLQSIQVTLVKRQMDD